MAQVEAGTYYTVGSIESRYQLNMVLADYDTISHLMQENQLDRYGRIHIEAAYQYPDTEPEQVRFSVMLHIYEKWSGRVEHYLATLRETLGSEWFVAAPWDLAAGDSPDSSQRSVIRTVIINRNRVFHGNFYS